MKFSQLFILIFLLVSNYCCAQLDIEDDFSVEVYHIIQSYREKGVQSFVVKYKKKCGKTHCVRDKFRYSFIDDTTIIHKSRYETRNYKITSNGLEWRPNKQDSLDLVRLRENVFSILEDSLDFRNMYGFRIENHKDTLLTFVYSYKNHGDTITKIHSYRNGLSWTGQKTIAIQLSDSTVFTQSWVYFDSQYYKLYDCLEIRKRLNNQYISVYTRTQYAGLEKSDEKVCEQITATYVIYHNDSRGFIQKVRRIEIEDYSESRSIKKQNKQEATLVVKSRKQQKS